jgi:hypothetical protein
MARKSWRFDGPGDFSYDSAVIEIFEDYARLKCLVPDLSFYARYDSSVQADFGLGSTIGRAIGGTAVTPRGGRFGGGCLDLTGEVKGRTVTYDAEENEDSLHEGCIKFWIKPAYEGTPGSFKHFFAIGTSLDVHDHKNYLSMYHGSNNGHVGVVIRDREGAEPVELDGGPWQPKADSWHHVELNWDIGRGETRLFIDGQQRGDTNRAKAERKGELTVLNVGKEIPDTFAPDFYIQDFHVFKRVQHTSDFEPPSAPTRVHTEDNPAIVTNPLSVYQFRSFTEERLPGGGDVRYILRINREDRFFDGSDWQNSDGSYGEASKAEQMTRGLVNYLVEGQAEIVALLHSTDGAASPRLRGFSASYIEDLGG